MRTRVVVSVELLADDGPRGERVIGSASAEHSHIVGVSPAYASDVQWAADTAGPIALRRAVAGMVAASGISEDRYPDSPRRQVVDSPQA